MKMYFGVLSAKTFAICLIDSISMKIEKYLLVMIAETRLKD